MQSSITCSIPHTLIQFPVGELHVQIGTNTYDWADITWNFRKSDDVMELLLFVDALHHMGITVRRLEIPYFPFSRQDRINQRGEALSVSVMADLINGLVADRVIIHDPHSDVTPALIHRCMVLSQEAIFAPLFPLAGKVCVLVSPDAGAIKKIYKLSTLTGLSVIECRKLRDTKTGEITGTYVPNCDLTTFHCVIVDDICDGGRTFIELAKALRAKGCSEVTLMVTHGFFTKGFQVFDGLIDHIYTRTGRIK